MKLDINCVRDVLLTIEERLNFGDEWTIEALQNYIPIYSCEELQYTCLKLHEAGYLNLLTVEALGCSSPLVARIRELTFQGHEFLETIRPKNVYDKTIQVAKSVGTGSLKAISDIAKDVLASVISEALKH